MVLLAMHRNISVQLDQKDALLVFGLLRINSLFMFGALLAHLQEALHKQQLVYCVCMYCTARYVIQ
jgi:hypothetical protein